MQDALEQQARAWVDADAPVLWLLGKTQAGKTSIVAEMTDQGYDEVGRGYRPMTLESRIYAFPPQQPVLRFLDTRGAAPLQHCALVAIGPGESLWNQQALEQAIRHVLPEAHQKQLEREVGGGRLIDVRLAVGDAEPSGCRGTCAGVPHGRRASRHER